MNMAYEPMTGVPVKKLKESKGKIVIFGNFGTQNIGNECTLQSVIYHLHENLPFVEVNCVCSVPDDISTQYGITAFEITNRHGVKPRVWPGRINALISICRKIFIRIPTELLQWVKAFKALRGADMFIIPGLGMLGDFGIGPFSLHYEILKWSILAKLRRSKLLFVSVGAGPISHPISRFFIKSALSLADYRSYRDSFSIEYMKSIGFNKINDCVYPDLVFSLPINEMTDSQMNDKNGSVIGVGLMEYYGNNYSRAIGEKTYNEYIEKISSFIAWLLKRKYSVRLLVGDVQYDKRVREDVINLLKKDDEQFQENQLINEPIFSVEQLISQLSKTDVVIATRFHNVLLALMLNKLVISISYHKKNDFLMAGFGLSEYCQNIESLNVDELIKQFIRLVKNAKSIKPTIQQKVREYRDVLDEQYTLIFKNMWTN